MRARPAVLLLAAIALATPDPALAQLFRGQATATGKVTAATAPAAGHIIVVRDGTRTSLAVRADPRQHPEEFLLVMPLAESESLPELALLPLEAFNHLQSLSAPRLVETWECDPCAGCEGRPLMIGQRQEPASWRAQKIPTPNNSLFDAAEYELALVPGHAGVSAWLSERGLPGPRRNELADSDRTGSLYLIARAVADRLDTSRGYPSLTPLRITFESSRLQLPFVALPQDAQGRSELLVSVLAGTRHRVNRPATVPVPSRATLPMPEASGFAEFYGKKLDGVFDRGAVALEYAGDPRLCKECVVRGLYDAELAELGVDWVLRKSTMDAESPLVFSRLHARFEAGAPRGPLELRSTGGPRVQTQFGVRHLWDGPTDCEQPVRGRFSASPPAPKEQALPPPLEVEPVPSQSEVPPTLAAKDAASDRSRSPIAGRSTKPSEAQSSGGGVWAALIAAALLVAALFWARWTARN